MPGSLELGSAAPLPADGVAPAASRDCDFLGEGWQERRALRRFGADWPRERAAHRSESEASRQLLFSLDLARKKAKISWCRDTRRGGAGRRGESGPKGSDENCGARARAGRVAHPTPVPVTWRVWNPFAV